MRLILVTAALTFAAAAPSFAGDRVSDAAYIAAVRCEAALGDNADASLKSFVKEQGRGRHEYVQDRASEAKRQARGGRQQAAAAQTCARYAAQPAMSATAQATTAQP